MADFLTAVKTTVQKGSTKKPEDVLTALSTKQTQDRKTTDKVEIIPDNTPDKISGSAEASRSHATTPEEVLEILRSQPDTESLLHTLNLLRHESGFATNFSIHFPGPLQAQITNTLVTNIVPAFWSSLRGKERDLLLSCLRTVAGTSAIIAKIRLLSGSAEKTSVELIDLLSLASDLFGRDDFALSIWTGLAGAVNVEVKRRLAWKEFVNLVGSGKVVATIAQAEDALKGAVDPVKVSWLSKGAEYAAWLGRSVARLMIVLSIDNATGQEGRDEAASQLLGKGFALGYSVPLVRAFLTGALDHSQQPESTLKGLSQHLPGFTKRQLLESSLQWLSSMTHGRQASTANASSLQDTEGPAISALISLILSSEASFPQHLLTLLSDPSLSSSLSITVRRACLIALDSLSPDSTQTLLEKTMTTFGDTLFINHAPIIQQESLAQIVLLVAGQIHRKSPMALLVIARSSHHMQGVSSRLDSTNSKARWLGMVVGAAISTLVDKEGSKMNFGTDELDTDEGQWYFRLVTKADHIGNLSDTKAFLKSQQGATTIRRKPERHTAQQRLPIIDGKPVFGPPRPPVPAQTEVIGQKIAEILEDDESDPDSDLKTYAKPDSDPEDSDEDATLVQRNKPRLPVYIRDLMRMLQDDKDPARFQLGITHAAALIRRKSNFGGEVTNHAEELASILCNLQDPFATDSFDELKLQALIAVLLSDVGTMAPWLGRQAFRGDYSISQRSIMLSAIGLGGRELAGVKNDLAPAPSTAEFPSKRLPGKLHALYNPSFERASTSLEHNLIQPLALSAADKQTEHLNAVKVRTFSSRNQRTVRKLAPNNLAKVFANTFFAPLMTHYQQEIAAYGQMSIYHTSPFLLVTFLKTVALLLHASGPATAELQDCVTVFWEVVLNLRVRASGDMSVLEAVLFSLLTLLEVLGEGSGVLMEFGKLLRQTKEWVDVVFERSGGGELISEGGGDEGRVRRLAAGVLVRIGDVGEVWERRMKR